MILQSSTLGCHFVELTLGTGQQLEWVVPRLQRSVLLTQTAGTACVGNNNSVFLYNEDVYSGAYR